MGVETRPKIAVFPGDGIGPEVMAEARKLLDAIGDFDMQEYPIGGASIDKSGLPLAPEVIDGCLSSDAVLFGAVGGKWWDHLEDEDGKSIRPEQGLLGLRKTLDTYANIRPIKVYDALIHKSPLKEDSIRGVNFTIVRELTGGIYFGEKARSKDAAKDVCAYETPEIKRIGKVAFELATKKVTSVDKANVLETSALWRDTISKLSREYRDIYIQHMYVDNAAMQIIRNPRQFEIIVADNMIGDILSDEAAEITGSIGTVPSASLSDLGINMYEPIHGSAPDIAGRGIANPIAMLGSVALMFRYSFNDEPTAKNIENAIEQTIEAGVLTPDLGGENSTEEVGQAIVDNLR